MNNRSQRQYISDVPAEIQDLIYDGKGPEAVNLLMQTRGLGKIQAAMELTRILARMKQECPDALASMEEMGEKTSLPPGLKKAILWMFMIMFLGMGSLFSFVGIRGIIRANASSNWPSTPGKVIASSVERKTSKGANNRRSTSYHARINYEFSVGGRKFKGDRVAYGDYGSKESHARAIVKGYPKGKNVTVHYMPGYPQAAVLETGVKAQAFLMPSIGLIALSVGLIAAFAAFKGRHRASQR